MDRKWAGGFINPYQKDTKRGLTHFLLWRFGYYKDRIPLKPIPEDFVYPNPAQTVDSQQPTLIWVNHSTFLIQASGKTVVVDPIWNNVCSPIPFVGPKRKHPPIPNFEEVPQIDYVVISHDHYDHLDKKTVVALAKKFPNIHWIVPRGVKKWFLKYLPPISLHELDWWEEISIEGVCFTSVPAQHFSGRGFFARNPTLWMGCVVEFPEGKKVYYVGDTGYNPFDFKEIGKKLGPLDLSLIPIGVYTPRRFMKPVHVNPVEAVQIHCDVNSKLSVGGHFGTFRLAHETLEQPPYDLYCALKENGISPAKFRVLTPGQVINW